MSRAEASAILVVEDEWLIAELIQETLQQAGYVVCGPVSNVEQAMQAIRSSNLSAAVLDVSLRMEKSFPVAEALAIRGVPFLFMTGYVSSDFPAELRSRPMLTKPVDGAKLLACLDSLLRAKSPDSFSGESLRREAPR
jgi:DNA-binding response OmpR family regulator